MVNNMLSYLVFNSLSFEISDLTFAYLGLWRAAAILRMVWPLLPSPFFSQPSVLPRPQLLSFDNHLDCLGSNGISCLLTRSSKLSGLFSTPCALFAKTTGVYANSYLPRRPSLRGQNGNATQNSCASSQPPFSLCYNLQFISSEENR